MKTTFQYWLTQLRFTELLCKSFEAFIPLAVLSEPVLIMFEVAMPMTASVFFMSFMMISMVLSSSTSSLASE